MENTTKAERVIVAVNNWFKENPERKICKTDHYEVRRGHVREDVEANYCSQCGEENEPGEVCLCQI